MNKTLLCRWEVTVRRFNFYGTLLCQFNLSLQEVVLKWSLTEGQDRFSKLNLRDFYPTFTVRVEDDKSYFFDNHKITKNSDLITNEVVILTYNLRLSRRESLRYKRRYIPTFLIVKNGLESREKIIKTILSFLGGFV